jgi:hypothetical protein
LQRSFDRSFAATGECHGEKINERAFGLVHDLGSQRIPFCLGDESRQMSCHFQIARHRSPREGLGASTGADKSARMGTRGEGGNSN